MWCYMPVSTEDADLYKMKIRICPIKEVRLSPDPKIDLEELRGADRYKRVCDRIKAVSLRSEG
jgi:hypothetical protein